MGSFAEFRKQQAKKGPGSFFVTVRHVADGREARVRCRGGTADMADVDAAFGLDGAWLQREGSEGIAVTLQQGQVYLAYGQRRLTQADLLNVRRVGFGCPPEVLLHAPPDPTSPHPERPDRIQHTLDLLAQHPCSTALHTIRPATPSQAALLSLVHTPQVVSRVRVNPLPYPARLYAPLQPPDPLEGLYSRGGGVVDVPRDTYSNAFTALAVDRSVACVAAACEAVYRGELDSGFCLVRPPGHHCTNAQPQGFCHVNNVAVGVAHMLEKHPGARIAVVDFDVHHGNGTQQIFEGNRQVLFVSLHRHDRGLFYPHTGSAAECGTHPAVGATVNLPFDTKRGTAEVIGDSAFEVASLHLVCPVLRAFRPDLVVVSAGFDAARGDPVGKMCVDNGFSRMVHHIVSACPKTVMVLEGGYNTECVAQGVVASLQSLLGLPPAPYVEDSAQALWALRAVEAVLRAQIAAGSMMAGDLRPVLSDVQQRAAAVASALGLTEEGCAAERQKECEPPAG